MASLKLDFSDYDRADPDELNRILWAALSRASPCRRRCAATCDNPRSEVQPAYWIVIRTEFALTPLAVSCTFAFLGSAPCQHQGDVICLFAITELLHGRYDGFEQRGDR